MIPRVRARCSTGGHRGIAVRKKHSGGGPFFHAYTHTPISVDFTSAFRYIGSSAGRFGRTAKTGGRRAGRHWAAFVFWSRGSRIPGQGAVHFMGTETSPLARRSPRAKRVSLGRSFSEAGLARRSLLAEAANRGGYGKLEIAVSC